MRQDSTEEKLSGPGRDLVISGSEQATIWDGLDKAIACSRMGLVAAWLCNRTLAAGNRLAKLQP